MRILLDAMGGDNAPDATIRGAVSAVTDCNAEIVLVGNETIINQKIKEIYGKDNIKEMHERLSIHHAETQIEMNEIPTDVIRKKKDSSMVVRLFAFKREKSRRIYLSRKYRSAFSRSNFACWKNQGNRQTSNCTAFAIL